MYTGWSLILGRNEVIELKQIFAFMKKKEKKDRLWGAYQGADETKKVNK